MPVAPAVRPADAALRFARTPGLAWLDGGVEHGREGRFSYVATAPCELLESSITDPSPLAILKRLTRPVEARGSEREPTGKARGSEREPREVAALGSSSAAALSADDIPYWVGHVSYDAALPLAQRRARPGSLPLVRFARYDAWYIFDHEQQCAYVAGDDERACERVLGRLQAPPVSEESLHYAAGEIEATPSALHGAAIAAALELIREGELYEINLARRFAAPFEGSALGLFLRLREASPVPLGYFVEGAQHAVLGRSMERFLRYRASDRALWTSPIKGTLAREGDDRAEADALRSDPKEHAEHAMVVDLMRNDLSRVCEVGSVSVSELMAVLPFRGLSHMVSTVRGRVRAEVDLHELLALTFPPGSVTGAPKERVMRAIGELEAAPRGLYTGCMGFVDRAGGCSLSVAIRTALVEGDVVSYFAGGGIVADSLPESELRETELKAQLFRAALRP
jgi:anthranilate/para-aminobenzoate synthase component I